MQRLGGLSQGTSIPLFMLSNQKLQRTAACETASQDFHLPGSARTTLIACDAFNARTVTKQKYHYFRIQLSHKGCKPLLLCRYCRSIYVQSSFDDYLIVRQKLHKRLGVSTALLVHTVTYPFACLYYNAVILRVFFVSEF